MMLTKKTITSVMANVKPTNLIELTRLIIKKSIGAKFLNSVSKFTKQSKTVRDSKKSIVWKSLAKVPNYQY